MEILRRERNAKMLERKIEREREVNEESSLEIFQSVLLAFVNENLLSKPPISRDETQVRLSRLLPARETDSPEIMFPRHKMYSGFSCLRKVKLARVRARANAFVSRVRTNEPRKIYWNRHIQRAESVRATRSFWSPFAQKRRYRREEFPPELFSSVLIYRMRTHCSDISSTERDISFTCAKLFPRKRLAVRDYSSAGCARTRYSSASGYKWNIVFQFDSGALFPTENKVDEIRNV